MASILPNPLSETEQIVELRKKLVWAELRIQSLEEQLRLQRIKKYGPGSEKLSDAQLQLLDLEPGVSTAEVQAESGREPLPAPAKPQRSRKHPGRQQLPAGLPRVERTIACTPEQCTCKACGQATVVIGHDVSEQLDVEPARYFVVVTKREKRACKRCEEAGVVAAPVPERIIEKSLVSDRVVIDTVVAKYSDHLPLYRQSVILQREAGVENGRATLDGWVMRVGELLIPMVNVIRRELLGGEYLQADETPVDVQLHDGRGQNHHAYLWQYDREAESSLTSAWDADAKGRRSSWNNSKAFCRPTAMSPVRRWAGRSWCTPDAGRIIWTLALSRVIARWTLRAETGVG